MACSLSDGAETWRAFPKRLFLTQSAVEKQKESMQKLQEVCNSLTQVENKLIGHQQLAGRGDAVDVQQYQKTHQVGASAYLSSLTPVMFHVIPPSYSVTSSVTMVIVSLNSWNCVDSAVLAGRRPSKCRCPH